MTGLRRGEKMFEELSYSYKLNKTQHPRIMSTVDSGLSGEELTLLIDATVDAMASDNYQELFSIIRQVCKGVANEKTSSDVFNSRKKLNLKRSSQIQHAQNSKVNWTNNF